MLDVDGVHTLMPRCQQPPLCLANVFVARWAARLPIDGASSSMTSIAGWRASRVENRNSLRTIPDIHLEQKALLETGHRRSRFESAVRLNVPDDQVNT